MTDTKLTAEQAVEEIRKRINTENYIVFYHDVMRILSRVQEPGAEPVRNNGVNPWNEAQDAGEKHET